MTKRAGRIWIVASTAIAAGTAIAVVGAAWAQSGKPGTTPGRAGRAAAPGSAPQAAVATVGGLPISRAAFEERVRLTERSLREGSSANIPADFVPVMRRQILEGLIREKLLLLEARRRGLSLTAEQAEAELKKDSFFQSNGLFDEAKFLAIKAAQPERFKSAIADLQNTLPAMRLRDRLQRESTPDSAAMRARLARELSRVTIDFLALRRFDFAGDSPQPSEAEILDHYRRHLEDYRLPEQIRVSILVVDRPPLTDSLWSDEKSVRAWEARMQQRADSLMGALKRGAPFDGVASIFGGLRTEVVDRDRFPKYWGAGGHARETVFSSPAGALIPDVVPGTRGRLIVRVDEHLPPRVAPIHDVAGAIRASLRAALAAEEADRELRSIYASIRDSLRGNAYRIRYAVADTAIFQVPEPSGADLDRYYRGHQADYAALDLATAAVITMPFQQVRDEVYRRLMRARRSAASRDAAERLLATWSEGKRDPRLEKTMALVRDVGPIRAGGVVDSGAVGAVLTDSLAAHPGRGTNLHAIPRGWLIAHVYETVRDYTPGLEESRPLLAERRAARRAAAEQAAARATFEARPERFRTGDVLRFSRLMVAAPEPVDVPLSRDEVEGWYRGHLGNYGAPELARIRHILISPKDASPAADIEARKLAESVLARLRAGEDFATLALRYSNDDATKSIGGDVGVFGRGTMLDEFERVAFAMRPGEMRGPVRTEVGYHLMECLEHAPPEVVPLKYCYTNVAVDAAREKGKRIARFRADSLLHLMKSVPQARALAARSGYAVFQNEHEIGSQVSAGGSVLEYIRRVEKMKPGQIYPAIQEYAGMGFAVTWIDSLLAPVSPTWDKVRDRALDTYREGRAREGMLAKRAELDSLFRSGWSMDSVAALWGGPETHGPAGAGRALERMGGTAMLDSLAFGSGPAEPVLQLGRTTDWIEFPAGIARLRLLERRPPDPVDLATRMGNDGRLALERSLRSAFDQIGRRFPAVILDHELRLTELPSVELQ